MEEGNDQQLIQALRNRDKEGLRVLYKKFYPGIKNYVLRNNGTKSDAKDVFHDGVLVLLYAVSKPGFKLTSSLFNFYFTVCKNIWFNKLRKKKRDSRVTLEDFDILSNDELITSLIVRNERKALFRDKFQLLSESCKKVLSLFFESRTMEEIMKIMNYSSVNYTKKRKFNCKKKLIEHIKSDLRFNELSYP